MGWRAALLPLPARAGRESRTSSLCCGRPSASRRRAAWPSPARAPSRGRAAELRPGRPDVHPDAITREHDVTPAEHELSARGLCKYHTGLVPAELPHREVAVVEAHEAHEPDWRQCLSAHSWGLLPLAADHDRSQALTVKGTAEPEGCPSERVPCCGKPLACDDLDRTRRVAPGSALGHDERDVLPRQIWQDGDRVQAERPALEAAAALVIVRTATG